MFQKKESTVETTQDGSLNINKKNIIIAIIIAVVGIVFMIVCKDLFYRANGDGKTVLLKKMLLLYMACFASYVFSLFWNNRFSETTNRIINIHIMEWYPVVCFILTEMTVGTGIDLINLNFKRYILNIALYMIVFYFIYVVTVSIKTSVITLTALTAIYTTVNIYLIRFRQTPLIATDFSVMKTAFNVAGGYDYTPNAEIVVLFCYLVAIIMLAQKIKEPEGKAKNIRHRIVVTTCYIAFFAVMYNRTIGTDFLEERHIMFNTFRPLTSFMKNGTLLTFTKSIKLTIVDKPEGYSTKEVDKITKDYTSDSVTLVDNKKQPNVIVIMDEAFADLQSVGELETNEEVLPFYNTLSEDTVKGFVYVSVFGGQTANSEYEFLTGDSKAFMPENSTPYQLYIKQFMPSLTGNMKLNGYGGMLALHPFEASGYNRINVYNNFGFSKFITMEEFENPTYVHGFIDDVSDFDKIISEYEKHNESSDEPFYMFNVTMQNHSSYDIDYEDIPTTIKITDEDKRDDMAERYLNLVHLSDEALKGLVEYFKNQDEPTVIVLFGDHEPAVNDKFYKKLIGKDLDSLTEAEAMEMYKTPFLIWANYDIEEKYIERVSANYLHSVMLDVVGLEKTGYNKFLLDMNKQVPVITVNGYFGADGNYYKTNDKTSPYYDWIAKYNKLEYNHLFDVDDRKNEFFEYAK
ncbi:MAG: LTA synthase family protein [Lachnospiraceae bacterium]|nr:LTA synthase family protein [Lachnospiraceae bacterium]